MIDVALETLHDSIVTLPILFITYLCIEYYETKATNQKNIFVQLQRYGPIIGSILAIIPQCGFSVIASMLFLEKKITIGTLLSVFIATSDEAIPILLTTPSMFSSLAMIIIGKVIIGITVGYLVDSFYHPTYPPCITSSSNEEGNVFINASIRTIKIYAFIFSISFILNSIVAYVGQDTLARMLWNDSVLQPILAATFGFIPNCVASVLLSQLYLTGSIHFASLFAGLTTNAGLGLLLLYRYHLDKKVLFNIIIILFTSASIIGILLFLA